MTAADRLGLLDGEQATGEGEIGTIRVELGLGVQGKRGKIHQGRAETRDPPGGCVDGGDPLDQPEKAGLRQWFTAEPSWCSRPGRSPPS